MYAYGTAMAGGFLLAWYFVKRWARERGLDAEKIGDLAVTGLVAGIAGGRLLYVITEWEYFWFNPIAIFKLWEGGLVFYGGLMAAVSVVVWRLRRPFAGLAAPGAPEALFRARVPLWETADVFAPAMALAHGVGRIGCFLNGCCYGFPSDRIGIVFPSLGDGVPRLPVQLIEAAGLFVGAWLLRRWSKSTGRLPFPGSIFFTYILGYSVWRLGLEFLRADDRGPMLFGVVSISQFISVCLMVWSFIMIKRLQNV